MKKYSQRIMLTLIGIMCTIAVKAYDVCVDGIYYNILSKTKTAEATYGEYNSKEYSGSVTIPKTITFNHVTYAVTSVGSYAFYNCTGLTSVSIPNSVTSIGSHAFWQCRGLTSVSIPNSVTSIGEDAFSHCDGITSVSIPNSVTSIENGAFYNCRGLTSVSIPNSVTSIGEYAFYNCASLTSVAIGNSVKNIGSSAFVKCTSLNRVNITDLTSWCKISFGFSEYSSNPLAYAHHLYLNGEEIKDLTIPGSVTSIGRESFCGCLGLTSVSIHSSVTSIGEDAFNGCKNLKSIAIPNSVTSIGSGAFYGCTGLTSVSIPNSVTSIEEMVFDGCSGLTSVSIPNSVTNIGRQAFYGCTGLTSVSIPEAIKSVGTYAFSGCKNIETVTCKAATIPSTSSDAFVDAYVEYATLKVPASALESYKSTAPWSSFGTIAPIEGTGVNQIRSNTPQEVNAKKIISNGRILIEKESKRYSTDGKICVK